MDMNYILFNIWYYLIAVPQYYLNLLIDKKLEIMRRQGLTRREIVLFVNILCSLLIGFFIRHIYDQFFNDWKTYIVMLVFTYFFYNKIHPYIHPVISRKVVERIRFIESEGRDHWYNWTFEDVYR